ETFVASLTGGIRPIDRMVGRIARKEGLLHSRNLFRGFEPLYPRCALSMAHVSFILSVTRGVSVAEQSRKASMMAKRVLVTGGAGFLGSHLCTALLERGCEVLCVDNFFTGARGNIDQLRDHPRFEIMRHDMILPLYVEVDEIYNLACPASPVH